MTAADQQPPSDREVCGCCLLHVPGTNKEGICVHCQSHRQHADEAREQLAAARAALTLPPAEAFFLALDAEYGSDLDQAYDAPGVRRVVAAVCGVREMWALVDESNRAVVGPFASEGAAAEYVRNKGWEGRYFIARAALADPATPAKDGAS